MQPFTPDILLANLEPLKVARESKRLSIKFIGDMLGVGEHHYRDVEQDDDELASNLGLREFWALHKLLDLEYERTVGILPGFDKAQLSTSFFTDLQTLVKGAKVTDIESLNYDIKPFLADADSAWFWNLDCLIEVCSVLRVPWSAYLPS